VTETLGRAEGPRGEVALRRRTTDDGGTHLELVVDGVFAMDDLDTSTERALATEALRRLPGRDLQVLVGGLGLGWTAATALAEPRVGAVEVVELHPALVRWAEEGRLPALPPGELRLRLRTGDVADVLAEHSGRWDAVLLDVDNGPGFLVHPSNEALYRPAGLTGAVAALRPHGVLAIWSSSPAPRLRERLGRLPTTADAEELLLPVARDGRELTYAVVLARRSAAG
jgi:spermidine synthase